MIKFYFFIIILSGVIFLGGCSARQVCNSSLHEVNLIQAFNNVKQVLMSEYISSINYIPFETNDSVLIGGIRYNFETDGNYIFVPSGNLQSTIYVFDNNGKYIKNIGRKGRGPGEYLAVARMKFYPESNTLMVQGGPKSLFYSFTDGQCIKQINANDFFDKSYDVVQHYKGMTNILQNISSGGSLYHNDSLYVLAANNTTLDQYLLLLDSNLTLKSKLDIGKTSLQTGMPDTKLGSIYLYNNTINIISGLYDTVFTYNYGKLTPHITFNYGKHYSLTTHPLRNRANYYSSKDYSLVSEMCEVFDLFEVDNAIIGWVNLPKSISTSKDLEPNSKFIYDKRTRETRLVKYSNVDECSAFINDIDGGMPFWPVTLVSNKLYQFVDAGTFIEMSKKYNSPRMKEIAATLTEESNPIIIEATLKE